MECNILYNKLFVFTSSMTIITQFWAFILLLYGWECFFYHQIDLDLKFSCCSYLLGTFYLCYLFGTKGKGIFYPHNYLLGLSSFYWGQNSPCMCPYLKIKVVHTAMWVLESTHNSLNSYWLPSWGMKLHLYFLFIVVGKLGAFQIMPRSLRINS